MQISIEVPVDDGQALLLLLKEKLEFSEVDWSEMQRADRSRVMWAPCPPRTDSGLTIDPFPAGE